MIPKALPLLAIFFFLTIWKCPAQSVLDSLTIELGDIYEESELPGFAVAILDQDAIHYQRSFGFADVASQKPYSIHTLQNIGSVSKTVIGVAIQKLVQEGKLTLDTEINALLPFPVVHPRFPDVPITVRHLATHTSGIVDSKVYYERCYVVTDPFPENLDALPDDARKEFEALEGNVKTPLPEFLEAYLSPGKAHYSKKHFGKDAPGTAYMYSNVGAALAALVVEAAAGVTFAEYTREKVLWPLGLQAAGWSFGNVNMDKHATLYFTNGVPMPRYTLVTFPDGGLIASCEDLSNYLQQVMLGYFGKSGYLSNEAWAEMLNVQFEGEKESSGIFWDITRQGNIGHNGGDPGIFTYIQFNPETEKGLVFMTNVAAYERPEMLESFKRIWFALIACSKKI